MSADDCKRIGKQIGKFASAVILGTLTGLLVVDLVRDVKASNLMPMVNATFTTAFASLPVTCRPGDLNYPTNSYYLFRCDSAGTAWAPWGPIYPMTRPVLASFTAINSASASETNGAIILTAPASAGDQIRSYCLSAPATPYTLTAYVLPTIADADFPNVGIAFRQSSDGKLVTYGFQRNSTIVLGVGIPNTYLVTATKWNSSTSFNSNASAINRALAGNWLRIADNGTNRIVSYGSDGRTFIPQFSEGNTTFLTADQLCFYAASENTTFDATVTVASWLVQ